MSGRKPKKVFVYSKSKMKSGRNFHKSTKYKCINDFRKAFFSRDIGKRPLFVKGDYMIVGDFVASLKSLTQKEIASILKRENSSLLCDSKPRSKMDVITMVNIDDEVLATFRNPLIASIVLNKQLSNITASIDCKQPFLKLDYTFKRIKN